MINVLVELFQSPERLSQLTRGLPEAFEIASLEMPKGNPAIGILREDVIIGFFMNAFPEKVKIPDQGIARGYDVEIDGKKLSIKTASSRTQVKVLWTVDPLKLGSELTKYTPYCDIFLVEIFWGAKSPKPSVFYIPVEVQKSVKEKLDQENKKYLDAKVGTNHRGIYITSAAMNMLRNDFRTFRAEVDWQKKNNLNVNQYRRWVEFWSERNSGV